MLGLPLAWHLVWLRCFLGGHGRDGRPIFLDAAAFFWWRYRRRDIIVVVGGGLLARKLEAFPIT